LTLSIIIIVIIMATLSNASDSDNGLMANRLGVRCTNQTCI